MHQTNPKLPESSSVAELLSRLRRRIREYVWVESIAVLLVLLGTWFWASLGFDWVFESPAVFREVLLGDVGLFAVLCNVSLSAAPFVRPSGRS